VPGLPLSLNASNFQTGLGLTILVSILTILRFISRVIESYVSLTTLPLPDTLIGLSIWGTAETTTTIMAASIPALRVLVREVHTTARNYIHKNSGGSGASGGSAIKNSAIRKERPIADIATIPLSPISADNSSDKSIINKDLSTSGRRQDEVVIEQHRRYSTNQHRRVEEYDMDKINAIV